MKPVNLLTAIIGFVQGYFGLVFIVGLASLLVNESIKFWKTGSLPISKFVTNILAYFFLILFFFGIAVIWIDFFSIEEEIKRNKLVKIWGKGWFLGLIIYCLLPVIERKFKKKHGN